MSKHPVFCFLLQRLHGDHRFSTDPFGALTEFKVLLEKAKKLTIRELSRKTPDYIVAKLSIAFTALRAYKNRHLGTLMRCCEAWKPLENCFDPISFECVDFQTLSHIIANLTHDNLAEREAEITNLPWTQTEKDNAAGQMQNWMQDVPGVSQNPCFALALSLMKMAIPWTTKTNQEECFVSIGEPFPSTCRKPETSPVRGYLTICSKSS